MSQEPPPELDPYAVRKPTVYATGETTLRPTGVTVIAVICLLAGIGRSLNGIDVGGRYPVRQCVQQCICATRRRSRHSASDDGRK